MACHGADGKGQSQNLAGFEPPSTFPDFSDCPTAAVEPDFQWRAIITNGGPARAFSTIMPSFKDLLTQEQIGKVVEHLRGFCADPAWPRGNLNLPRALITEKAFPENETVVAGAISAHGSPGVGSTVIYEKRIGATGDARSHRAVRLHARPAAPGAPRSAISRSATNRRCFTASGTAPSSAPAASSACPPAMRPRAAAGPPPSSKRSPRSDNCCPPAASCRCTPGSNCRSIPIKLSRVYFLRTAIGKTFSQEGGLGRRWSPIVEFIAERDLVSGGTTNWDIVPELQIPLSKRMHILGSVGLRIPANNTGDRQKQVLFYVLWDWMDGGLTQGW